MSLSVYLRNCFVIVVRVTDCLTGELVRVHSAAFCQFFVQSCAISYLCEILGQWDSLFLSFTSIGFMNFI